MSTPVSVGTSAGPHEGSATAVLSVEDLSVTFGRGDRAIRAVRSVSFSVGAGRTLVLLGESGSGKSVSARAVLRLHGAGAEIGGRVLLDGQDLLGLPAPAMRSLRGSKLALVPQDPNASLDPLRHVGDQIAEVLLVHKAVPGRRSAVTRALELLALVGIPEPRRVFGSFPHELSGGMRQRVAIAIAVSCDPAVLIADEPTTALDVTVQAQILALFAELQQRLATAMIFVTHDVSVAGQIADEVAVMYAGSVVEHGPAAEVLADPRHPYTAALLAAVPTPESERGSLRTIPGSPPVAGQTFTGCPLAPRCSRAQASCEATAPALALVAAGHRAACPVVNPSPHEEQS